MSFVFARSSIFSQIHPSRVKNTPLPSWSLEYRYDMAKGGSRWLTDTKPPKSMADAVALVEAYPKEFRVVFRTAQGLRVLSGSLRTGSETEIESDFETDLESAFESETESVTYR